MIENPKPPVNAPATQQWKPDLVFSILAEAPRRRLLATLAHGHWAAATELRGASRKRLDATLKHLATLRAAGFLVTAPDPKDGRRTLYALAPTVPVQKTPEGGTVIDFGFCLLRV